MGYAAKGGIESFRDIQRNIDPRSEITTCSPVGCCRNRRSALLQALQQNNLCQGTASNFPNAVGLLFSRKYLSVRSILIQEASAYHGCTLDVKVSILLQAPGRS